MAHKNNVNTSEGIPDWLAQYAQQARDDLAEGRKPRKVENVAQEVGVPPPTAQKSEDTPPKTKGVTPRRRAGGWVFEVRHKGQTIGTFDSFHEAVRAKERAK